MTVELFRRQPAFRATGGPPSRSASRLRLLTVTEGLGLSGGHGDCCGPEDLSHSSPRYRRALLVVIALNLGSGVAEMTGGVLGSSQALKADALDFFGDGLITLLALLAIAREPRWRAKAALLQGVFLAALGLGVIGAALYRTLVQRTPDAPIMGALGSVALGANLASALVLLRHRRGDASVRAVWLFSRNDALGNIAVILAAGLVAWTGTPWPDLVAAFGIAGLFLASSLEIMRAARAELSTAHEPRPITGNTRRQSRGEATLNQRAGS